MNEVFIFNDLRLDSYCRMLVIIGFNMGGKLIFMCQIVLIVILVYIGSFVLVEKVCIGFIDCIFICIGFFDDLVSGCLIFMVEMIEIVSILYNVM